MPWMVVVQSTLIVATGSLLAALAVSAAHRWSWHLPPDDPTAQFELVQRAWDRARRVR